MNEKNIGNGISQPHRLEKIPVGSRFFLSPADSLYPTELLGQPSQLDDGTQLSVIAEFALPLNPIENNPEQVSNQKGRFVVVSAQATDGRVAYGLRGITSKPDGTMSMIEGLDTLWLYGEGVNEITIGRSQESITPKALWGVDASFASTVSSKHIRMKLQDGSLEVALPGTNPTKGSVAIHNSTDVPDMQSLSATHPDNREGLSSGDDAHRLILEALTTEFLASRNHQELLAHAYDAIRGLSEEAFINQDGVARRLIHDAMQAASFNLQFGILSDNKFGGTTKTRNPQNGKARSSAIEINFETLSPDSLNITATLQRLSREGVTNLSAEQVASLAFLKTMTHEVGHTIETGMGMLAGKAGAEAHDFAANNYIAKHKTSGISHGSEQQLSLLHERFAEGYSDIIFAHILSKTNLTSEQQLALQHAMRHTKKPGYSDPMPAAEMILYAQETADAVKAANDF